jgi:hypothetical protein
MGELCGKALPMQGSATPAMVPGTGPESCPVVHPAKARAITRMPGFRHTDPIYGTLLMCSASILTFSRTWSRPPYQAYGPPVYFWDSASIEASPPSLVTSITRPRIW